MDKMGKSQSMRPQNRQQSNVSLNQKSHSLKVNPSQSSFKHNGPQSGHQAHNRSMNSKDLVPSNSNSGNNLTAQGGGGGCPVISSGLNAADLLNSNLSMSKVNHEHIKEINFSKEAEARALHLPKNLEGTNSVSWDSFALTVAISPVPLVSYDSEGTVKLFNDAASLVFGISQEEVIGQNVSLFIQDEKEMIQGKDSENDESKTCPITNKQYVRKIVLGKKNDSEIFPLEVCIGRVQSESESSNPWFFAYMKDLSDDIQAMAIHKLYSGVMNLSTTPIIGIEEDGLIRLFSPAAEHVFKYKREQVLGKNISILMPARIGRFHDEYLRNYLRTGKKTVLDAVRYEQGKRSNAEIFPIELKATEIQITPTKKWFIGFVRDLSDRTAIIRDEEEVAKLSAKT